MPNSPKRHKLNVTQGNQQRRRSNRNRNTTWERSERDIRSVVAQVVEVDQGRRRSSRSRNTTWGRNEQDIRSFVPQVVEVDQRRRRCNHSRNTTWERNGNEQDVRSHVPQAMEVGGSLPNSHDSNCCVICGTSIVEEEPEIVSDKKVIPGFYFDAEKNRYYRITTDHPTPKPETIVETICKKCKQLQEHRRARRTQLAKYILSRPYQPAPPIVGKRDILERLICQAEVNTELHLDPTSYYVNVDKYAITLIQPDARKQKILSLYEASPPGKIVQFHGLIKDKNNNLSIKHNMSMIKNQNVTALVWSPHLHSEKLYTCSLLGYRSKDGETLLFEVNDRYQRLVTRFPVHGHTVWTSDWNRNPIYDNIISIGASRLALTIDIKARRRLIHAKSISDVFAQRFSNRSPILFNGSRDGTVRTCDFRLKVSTPVKILSHGSPTPITCIRVLNDENYIISSAMNGTMKMWDLRLSRVVQNYYGHVNEITHGLPFCLDATDTLLFAAGQDSVTRIWSVRSGEILHTIPYPDGAARDLCAIPALHYAEEWGGPGGKPGLFYGINDKIRFYAL